ncbi:MAG: hypothetical protein M1826_000840 [Phylliscum demangeonii]|nr:MAG: hypothetical protein M1826_000840 [Phylliscum demangeonii]
MLSLWVASQQAVVFERHPLWRRMAQHLADLLRLFRGRHLASLLGLVRGRHLASLLGLVRGRHLANLLRLARVLLLANLLLLESTVESEELCNLVPDLVPRPPSSLSQPIQPGAQSASKPNPFSSTPTQNGPASQTQTQGDAFGTNGFASAALPAPFSNTQPPGASMDPRTFSTRDASNRLLTWKSKPVTYVDDEPCYTRDDDGTYERIWFPAGPPPVDESCELPLEMYDEKTKAAYLYVRDHGEFKDGWIPPLPPRREWCRFDL